MELRARRDTSSPITIPARPQAYLRDQALEPLAINRGRAGQAEVRVDYDDLINAPSEGDRALSQVVLALSALGILKQLSQRGLPVIPRSELAP